VSQAPNPIAEQAHAVKQRRILPNFTRLRLHRKWLFTLLPLGALPQRGAGAGAAGPHGGSAQEATQPLHSACSQLANAQEQTHFPHLLQVPNPSAEQVQTLHDRIEAAVRQLYAQHSHLHPALDGKRLAIV